MYLEGIVALPRDRADLDRFEAEVRTAKQAGAEVVRTVMLSGRRYETFATLDAFQRFADASIHALELAAPIVARHGILLAVENHKDWRADELLAVLKRAGNDHVGVCLDTGNSIALLEDPMEVDRGARTPSLHDALQGHGARGVPARVPARRGRLRQWRPRPGPRCASPSEGSPRDSVQHRDDHPRPAPRALPHRSILGDLPRPARATPGPGAHPRPRPSAESSAPAHPAAAARGAAPRRGRKCPPLPRLRARSTGVVRESGRRLVSD